MSASSDGLLERLCQTLAARGGDPSEVLVHERRLDARSPNLGVLRPRLPIALARALVQSGIAQLYSHQVETVEALRSKHNVVLSSPTASGKSLAFALPTFERLIEARGRARALYLYPTKALIGDQQRALEALAARLPPFVRPRIGVLTGDTSHADRQQMAAVPPDVLLANPDILHHHLLPGHRRWQTFLAGLEVVVVDELHTYRGVFGAHVALLLRRLRRLAAAYGAQPAFVAASATIGNPVELAEQVVGLPFVSVQGDAAGSGPRRFLFWRPPLRGDAELNEHESVFDESVAVFAEALRAGYSGILFGRARTSVERMLLDVRRLVGPSLAPSVSAYKAGYRLDERAQIEAGLRSGELRGVVSTNALELGIDVGSLDVAVLAGFPGSNMSFWQQAGRVGRRVDREAVVVFVAGDDALDQYHIQHPDAFFGQAIEQAVVDPSNAVIQLGHLLCAAAERPLTDEDLAIWPANARDLVRRLVEAGELSAGPPWRATSSGTHRDVSLRGTIHTPYTLQVERAAVGTIEPPYLQRECFPGAVYLHNGRAFRVLGIDHAARVVQMETAAADVRTRPVMDLEVAPREAALATRRIGIGEVSVGPLRVREGVIGYRESARGQAFSYRLEQPLEHVLETVGVWLDVPAELEPDAEALHALEHALVNALPLELLCDRRDVGSTTNGNRVYVYDAVDGGIGLSEKAFHLLERLFERGAALLRDCPCAAGCPSCVHLAGCPRGNAELDKTAGLALLEGRSASAARAAAAVLRTGTSGRAGAARSDQRRRLREIADADLRARFAQREWLHAGALATLADVGLVVIWNVDARAGRAEVQSLTSGETSWVELARLSQPTPGA